MMNVFKPARLGDLSLANCFVRSATGEELANTEGRASTHLMQWMVRLAQGGAGLMITGQTAVSREGRANPRQLCLWDADHLPALLDMTSAVHDAGGKIVIQLSHAGIFAQASQNGRPAFGPMLYKQRSGMICREMTRLDIRRTTKAFARAAVLAAEAGFDGVQVLAAHGHLLSSFLSPHYNRRRDEYGGTPENRIRFLTDVLQAVGHAAGKNFPVLVKMNAQDFLPGGVSINEMLATAEELERADVTAIELSGGTAHSGMWMPARPGPLKFENEGYYKEEASYYKKKIKVPLILGGGIRSLSTAERFIQDGLCDLVAMARPFICEPDLIKRWQNGNAEKSPCTSDNQCLIPVRAGKGLCCLAQVREKMKAL